jgi:hypothetical protein
MRHPVVAVPVPRLRRSIKLSAVISVTVTVRRCPVSATHGLVCLSAAGVASVLESEMARTLEALLV